MRRLTITAVLTFVIDQISKLVIFQGLDLINRGEIDVFPPFLVFRMAWNRGINFGLFANNADVTRWALIAIAILISAWVLWWIRRDRPGPWAELAAGLLIGGALGNVIDRLLHGYVVDFLQFRFGFLEPLFHGGYFPSFNLADSAITLGACCLILDEILRVKRGR